MIQDDSQKQIRPDTLLKRRLEDLQDGEVKVPALRGITIDIKKGDFVAITGASGSGKSTLMNLMGCLDIPTRGHIYLKSRDISSMSESDLATFRGRTIGFVFQQYNLIPSLSAFENVMLPLEFMEYGDDDAARRARSSI